MTSTSDARNAPSSIVAVAAARYLALATHPIVRRSTVALAVLLTVGLVASQWGQILIRTDISWPDHRVFWLERPQPPFRSAPFRYERGDLVAYLMTEELAAQIRPPERRTSHYVRIGTLFMKRILGVPGDHVQVESLPDGRSRILINGRTVGETVSRDRLGQPMEVADLSPVIPPGQYYVSLDHPRSFDSRYYGYVPAHLIQGKITPLW